jgi:hypothetical protein
MKGQLSRTAMGHVPSGSGGQRDRTTPALGGVVPCPLPPSEEGFHVRALSLQSAIR